MQLEQTMKTIHSSEVVATRPRRQSSAVIRGTRASVVECGGPPPLFEGVRIKTNQPSGAKLRSQERQRAGALHDAGAIALLPRRSAAPRSVGHQLAQLRLFCASLAIVFALVNPAPAQTAANGNFTGKVVDSKGQPVSGATVEVYQARAPQAPDMAEMDMKQRVTTDNGGSFTVTQPTIGTIIVTKAGFGAAWRTRFLGGGAFDAGAFVLSSPSFLGGIVVDEHGQPMANADVSVQIAVAQPRQAQPGIQVIGYAVGAPVENLFHARTGPDGRFRIADFPQDATASLLAHAAGKVMRIDRANRQAVFDARFRAGQDDIKLVIK